MDRESAGLSAPAAEAIEAMVSPSLEAPDESLPSFEAPSFESADDEPSASDGGFAEIEPEEESVSVPAFGAPFESPAPPVSLADENAAAEERDKAKLQAPPLPSLEKAPAAPIPGDTEFEGNAASIPLAGQGATSSPSLADSTQRGPEPAGARAPAVDLTGGEMQTQPGIGKPHIGAQTHHPQSQDQRQQNKVSIERHGQPIWEALSNNLRSFMMPLGSGFSGNRSMRLPKGSSR